MLSPHIIDDIKRKKNRLAFPQMVNQHSVLLQMIQMVTLEPRWEFPQKLRSPLRLQFIMRVNVGKKSAQRMDGLILGVLLVGIAFVFRGGCSKRSGLCPAAWLAASSCSASLTPEITT